MTGFQGWRIHLPKDDSRIDEFLPTHDFSAVYEIGIDAPAPVVYECLLRSDFSEAWLVRLLMTVRSGKRLPRTREPSDLRRRLQGTGFVILDDVPGEELVIGVAGKFWRPDGGRRLDLTTGDFGGFSRPGYAKVAWNFRLKTESPKCLNRDEDQVLRSGGVAEVSHLLESKSARSQG